MKSRKKIIHENVLKTYKKADMSLPKKISKKNKKVVKTFDVADRLDIMAKQECFITLKSQRRI